MSHSSHARIKRFSLVAVLVLVATLLIVELSAAVSVPTATRMPAMVVRDHSGTLVGHFAGITSNGGNFFPVVALQDGSDIVFLEVYDQNTLTTRRNVYYTNVGCTGTAYLQSPNTSFIVGAARIQGVQYGVGNGHELYATTGTSAGSPTIQSHWDSIGETCTSSSNPGNLETTTFVVDLDTLFNFTSFSIEPI